MIVRASLFAAALLGLAACATPSDSAGLSGERDCFHAQSVSGYSVVDDHNVRVRVGPSRSYTLHTSWNVNDLDWTQAIALRSDNSFICTGNAFGRVELIGGQQGRTFPIQTITRDPDPPGQTGS